MQSAPVQVPSKLLLLGLSDTLKQRQKTTLTLTLTMATKVLMQESHDFTTPQKAQEEKDTRDETAFTATIINNTKNATD